jgi:hypothetical protein
MRDVMQQDPDGVWRPAIPLPFYRGRLLGQYQCMYYGLVDFGRSKRICGCRFRTMDAYKTHYRQVHTVPEGPDA